MFDNKNNNMLQFNIILNNEVVMLESFIQNFWQVFSQKKNNYLVPRPG